MEATILIPLVLACCGLTFALGWIVNSRLGQNKVSAAREESKKILDDAAKEAETLKREKLLEVKDEWYRKKKDFDVDVQTKRSKLQAQEKALDDREENIDRKVELLGKKEREMLNLKRDIESKTRLNETPGRELDQMIIEENRRPERASGLSRGEAKRILMQNLGSEARTEAAHLLKEIRDKAKEEARKEAQKDSSRKGGPRISSVPATFSRPSRIPGSSRRSCGSSRPEAPVSPEEETGDPLLVLSLRLQIHRAGGKP